MLWIILSTALVLLPVTWALWSAYRLVANYMIASRLGLPLVIMPVATQNPVWMLLADFVVPALQKNNIARSWPIIRYGRRSWEFKDKAKTHLEIGDLFVMVTPVKNILYICNADTMAEVMQRRNEFQRPPGYLDVLNVFGPNLSTVRERDWQRHKKATAAPFNEQNNKLVWEEALRQGQQMIEYWLQKADENLRTTADDTKAFSLNVMSCAGFGKSYPFHATLDTNYEGTHTMSYKQSLGLILEHAFVILIIGPAFLYKWKAYLPKSWQEVTQAAVEFRSYMTEMLQEQRKLIAEGKPLASNLMTSLVRASEIEKDQNAKDQRGERRKFGLSEDEIFGNIFLFNFAGHDTISHTLAYAILLLAAHPSLQDWVSEEIKAIFPDPDISKWNYDEAFLKLNRCLAVLFETLRLYDPVMSFNKMTGDSPRTLTYNSQLINLPAETLIFPNLLGLQCHPRYWGEDRLLWQPKRWIQTSKDKSESPQDEKLWTPPKGSFLPWADGPRGCPGKKFSQVEFVAAISVLLRDHRVKVVKEGNESDEEARARVQDVVDDSAMVLLLQMLKPERVALRWVRV